MYKLTLPGNLPPIELDYLQIDQVITNLLKMPLVILRRTALSRSLRKVVDGTLSKSALLTMGRVSQHLNWNEFLINFIVYQERAKMVVSWGLVWACCLPGSD